MGRDASSDRGPAGRAARRARPGRPRVPVARPAPPSAHRDRRRSGPSRPQRGAALVVALVLLVATTVVAVSTLSGTRLSETMASNAQIKSIVFEAAESGIESAWAGREAVVAALAKGSGNAPGAQPLTGLGLAERYDQARATAGETAGFEIDLEIDLTVQYCGEVVSRTGSEMNADLADVAVPVSYVFDIVSAADSVVTEAGTQRADARARHVQRGAVGGPRTGRTGACAPP